MADPSNSVAVSAATVWEVEIKKRAGKLHFIGEMVALDKILELFNDLARTLDVT